MNTNRVQMVIVARSFRGVVIYLESVRDRGFCWTHTKSKAMHVTVAEAKQIITDAQGYKADAFAMDADGTIIIPKTSGASSHARDA